MISFLLAQKIFSLFIMVFLGIVIVKAKLLKPEDSRILSVLSVYLVTPCTILSAFQVEADESVKQGLILAFAAAVLVHILLILLTGICHKIRPLDPVEQVSMIYPNAGNLIIPLVTYVMGKEWVIFTSAYISVQLFMLWSHGRSVLCGDKKIDVKKIFLNCNMITIFVGILLFLLQIRFPAPVQDVCDSVGGMMGPLAMLITGMLIGGKEPRKILEKKRIWAIVGLRLLLLPALIMLVLKYSGLAGLVPDGESILLITLLATSAPSASAVTQMSQVYNRDVDYASAINILTILFSIITMPAIVFLYQM